MDTIPIGRGVRGGRGRLQGARHTPAFGSMCDTQPGSKYAGWLVVGRVDRSGPIEGPVASSVHGNAAGAGGGIAYDLIRLTSIHRSDLKSTEPFRPAAGGFGLRA